MKLNALLVTVFASYTAANIGGDCHNAGGNHGTCEKVTWCNSHSGDSSVSNLCPWDPDDVKCCIYPKCDGHAGYCMKTNDPQCNNAFVSNHCPGGDDYKCCTNWG